MDMYLAYLRAAYNTCYYCSVVTDHVEELQRKCLKHARKPLSKMLLDELKTAETEKAEKDKKSMEVDSEKEGGDKDEKDKDKAQEAKKESSGKTENRDWKRNGVFSLSRRVYFTHAL